jgi:multidrug resistance protein
MVAPALTAIAREFNITNEVEQSLTLSIFVLAYAIGPLFLGPLSEMYGRVIVLQTSNLLYLFFNLGCGLAQTKGQLIAFRFLSGLGGSAPLALGGGVLSDLFTAEERGKAISIYSLAPLLGPAVGPIAGGFITEKTTWRVSNPFLLRPVTSKIICLRRILSHFSRNILRQLLTPSPSGSSTLPQ